MLFRVIHVGDTLLPIDPAELPDRLRTAGLERPERSAGQRLVQVPRAEAFEGLGGSSRSAGPGRAAGGGPLALLLVLD